VSVKRGNRRRTRNEPGPSRDKLRNENMVFCLSLEKRHTRAIKRRKDAPYSAQIVCRSMYRVESGRTTMPDGECNHILLLHVWLVQAQGKLMLHAGQGVSTNRFCMYVQIPAVARTPSLRSTSPRSSLVYEMWTVSLLKEVMIVCMQGTYRQQNCT
jgi:hypothetical protein